MDDTLADNMALRWRSFCTTLKPQPLMRASESAFGALQAYYGEIDRAYHTLEHIQFCLNTLIRVRGFKEFKGCDPRAIEGALWYHDTIYQPGAPDNEEHSAQFADSELAKLLQPNAFRRKVKALILATKHEGELEGLDEQLIADIDLSSLGLEWPAFAENARRIQREFDQAPCNVRQKPREFLKHLFARPHIYHTKWFRRNCEKQARENIALAVTADDRT